MPPKIIFSEAGVIGVRKFFLKKKVISPEKEIIP